MAAAARHKKSYGTDTDEVTDRYNENSLDNVRKCTSTSNLLNICKKQGLPYLHIKRKRHMEGNACAAIYHHRMLQHPLVICVCFKRDMVWCILLVQAYLFISQVVTLLQQALATTIIKLDY